MIQPPIPKSSNKWVWIILSVIFGLFLLTQIMNVFSGDGLSLGEKVGIVRLEGPIMSSKSVVRDLEKFRKREDVKAIVLRIDSPGGAVAPSQEIYEKVKKLTQHKPVVVSMGSVGASGGYYAALGSDKIVVNRGSIVGSIGVILEYPVAVELLNKIGLRFETIKSGDTKDSGSPTRKVTEEDRITFKEVIMNLHGQFKRAVSDGRKLSMDVVESLADGRVFTGEQSVEIGLADTIGTMDDAIVIAGVLGKISGSPTTVEAQKKRRGIINLLLGEAEEKIGSRFDVQPAYRWR